MENGNAMICCLKIMAICCLPQSISYLRKTPWVRAKVEILYLYLKRREKKMSIVS